MVACCRFAHYRIGILMIIKEIISAIEEYAPLSLQESWDNAGVQVGGIDAEATGALLCVDVTECIVDEAVAKGANLVISHHPLLFKGLKRIVGATPVERIVAKALRNGITIYSAHTNMDSTVGGVSWRDAEKLGLKNVHVLAPQSGQVMKLVTFVPVAHVDAVSEAMWQAGAGQIGNYDRCAYRMTGTGTYRPVDGANSFAGHIGEQHEEAEVRVEVVFPVAITGRVVSAMLAAHPYEEPAYDLFKLENKQPTGLGIVGEIEQPVKAADFIAHVKHVLNIASVPCSGNLDATVKKVALCGGAGGEFIPDAIRSGADIYMCGDLKYHDFTSYNDRIVIANIGHYESEECTKGIFYDIIKKKFPNFATYYAELEKNPISFL